MLLINTYQDYYKVSVVGSFDQKDCLDQIHDKRARWSEFAGVKRFSHYEIAKYELCNILRLIDIDQIQGDEGWWQDVAEYDDLLTPWGELPQIQQPLKFSVPPLPHQERTCRLPTSRRHLILSYDTGCGKTIGALERIGVVGMKRTLIFTIQSNIDDWVDEIRTIWKTKPLVHEGTAAKRDKILKQIESTHFLVSTYSVCGELRPYAHLFDTIIYDEADLWSNPETATFKDLKPILDGNRGPDKQGLYLTATPIAECNTEAWTLAYAVNPKLAGSYSSFEALFTQIDGARNIRTSKTLEDGRKIFFTKKTQKRVSPQNIEMFNKRLAGVLIRVEGKQFFNFEEKREIIKLPMASRQQEVYDKMKEELHQYALGRRVFQLKEAQVKMMRLRQAAEALFNLEDGFNDSNKFDYLVHYLKSVLLVGDDRKRVIWSPFREITDRLHQVFPYHAVVFNGSQNREQKKLAKWCFQGIKHPEDIDEFDRLVEKYNCPFKTPGSAPLWFGVMNDRTSRGINLQRAYQQIYTSLPLSNSTWTQTKGRILRVGQINPLVLTHILESTGSIDPIILQMITNKENNVRYTNSGDETLTADNVKMLIRRHYMPNVA